VATLQQIRSQSRNLINQTDSTNSHVDDTTLNDFINQAVRFTGTQIEYPRDFVEVQVEEAVGAYTVPSDMLIIRTAYFGDKSIQGDLRPLSIISEETLREMKRNWLEETSVNVGRPERIILLDRNTVFVEPRPDVENSASGKKLIMDYVYVPGTLTSDSQSPDLPLPFHDILSFYAAHLAYLKMTNQEMADKMYANFEKKIEILKPSVTRETKEGMGWQWGFSDDVNDDNGYGGLNIP